LFFKKAAHGISRGFFFISRNSRNANFAPQKAFNFFKHLSRNNAVESGLTLTQRPSAAKPQPKKIGLRREAKRHAALEALSAVEKRCRRCALPPHSKILAAHDDSDVLHCRERGGPQS